MRVAAVKNAAPLDDPERTLKNAKIVAADNENEAFGLTRTDRPRVRENRSSFAHARRRCRARACSTTHLGPAVAFALPKTCRPPPNSVARGFRRGREEIAGAVQRAIHKAGLAGEVKVAPPSKGKNSLRVLGP